MQSINLVDGSNKVLATLAAAPDGGGALTFFDSNGKRLIGVGVSDDGTAAGVGAFDGNTLASGNGVLRTTFGVGGIENFDGGGFGLVVVGADGATNRVSIGSSLDGTTLPSYVSLFDGSGDLRTGVQVLPSSNFVGFYSGLYTVTGGKGTPLVFTGSNQSLVGNAYDKTSSFGFLYDSSGNMRNGLEYNPSLNFNGFISQDGANHLLSAIGNGLTTTSSLQANESLMQLDDASGTLRLIEFQNSTNEGGVDFNSGSTTAQGAWGNP